MTDPGLIEALDRLAAREPAPGGGAAAAWGCAMAASLVQMAAAFADGHDAAGARAHELRARALELATADGQAYARYMDARADGPDAARAALVAAAEPPLAIAEAAAEVAELAAALAERGNPNLRGDAATGATLAEAAAAAACLLAEIDLGGESERGRRAVRNAGAARRRAGVLPAA
jgi:formiminotetrahydrofolate cyclodeaminase